MTSIHIAVRRSCTPSLGDNGLLGIWPAAVLRAPVAYYYFTLAMVGTGMLALYAIVTSPEVENVLYQHPTMLEAAVIGVPDTQWGEAVLALVVLQPGAMATAAALIAHCRERIAHYKCQRRVELRSEPLPKSGSGKILKAVLRKPHWQG